VQCSRAVKSDEKNARGLGGERLTGSLLAPSHGVFARHTTTPFPDRARLIFAWCTFGFAHNAESS